MKVRILLYCLLSAIALSSCVSKKKYLEARRELSDKDQQLNSERTKMLAVNDSLRMTLSLKDAIIDSLSEKLNEALAKKEKERKSATLAAKKTTMSKEQVNEKKSLFIYNFTKLIEWPIEYNGIEFVIGIAGDDETVKQLQGFMAQKKVSGKKIIVEKYRKGGRYNVIYVTSSSAGNFASIKNSVKKNKTLLVSDDAAQGTHISFLLDQDKVRYFVDKAAIEKAGMKVGQELMRYSG
jgi:hypothetical protein